MTEKTLFHSASGQTVKTPGWFSWRHQTRDAHDEAREKYLANRGPAARRRRALERQEAAGVKPEPFAHVLLRRIFADEVV